MITDLIVELHGQGHGIEKDGHEDGVLTERRRCKGPQSEQNKNIFCVNFP